MTDHKAEAMDFLNIAYQYENDPHEVRCAHVSALVQTGLAIAEQQRIANLIAFVRSPEDCFELENTSDWKRTISDSAVDRNSARHAIREGLGI